MRMIFSFLFFLLVAFSANAQTFVSLKPNITQTLIEMGVSTQIVGITKFCRKPNANASIVADYQHIDVETLVRLNPDYILLSPENTQKKQFEQLHMAFDGTHTKILLLHFDTLEDFFQTYLKLAEILQQTDVAKTQIKTWQTQIEQLSEAHAELAQKTFAIIVQREPLIVASGHTYLSSLFSALGFKNVFARNQIPYPTLNPETLLQAHPDILFDMSHKASENPKFWGQSVHAIQIEDYLAHPTSVENAVQLVRHLLK